MSSLCVFFICFSLRLWKQQLIFLFCSCYLMLEESFQSQIQLTCENSFNTCHLIKGNIQADPDKGIKKTQKSSWLLGSEYSSFSSSPTFDFRQMLEENIELMLI